MFECVKKGVEQAGCFGGLENIIWKLMQGIIYTVRFGGAASNGKEATVNRALDDSTYPG